MRRQPQELAPAVFALIWLWRVFLVRDALPDLLEDGAREQSAEDAEEQSEGPVGKFRHARAPLPGAVAAKRTALGFSAAQRGNDLCPTARRKGSPWKARLTSSKAAQGAEGKLTDDELREKQGQAQQKVGEGKEQLVDAKDEARERM